MRARRLASLAVSSTSIAEVVAAQGDRLEEGGVHRLVAGLHVGEVQVGEPVADRGEQPVDHRVAVHQGAPAAPTGSASRTPRPRLLARRAAAARVCPRGSYSRSASCTTLTSPRARATAVRTAAPLPWLRSWRTRTHPRVLRADALQHVPRPVGAVVVHDHHLQRADRRCWSCQHAAQAGRHHVPLVVDGHQHAEVERLRGARGAGQGSVAQ